MDNCLVTKLKGIVSDNTFPVLEVMQQLTLDAIAASHNDSLTDDQIFALNHYFYQLGAFDGENGNALWGKVDKLFIPLIAGGLSYQGINYKNSTTEFTVSTNYTNSNNGLEYTGVGLSSISLANTFGFTSLKGAVMAVTSPSIYLVKNKNLTFEATFSGIDSKLSLSLPYPMDAYEVSYLSGKRYRYNAADEVNYVGSIINVVGNPTLATSNIKVSFIKENGTVNSGTPLTPSSASFVDLSGEMPASATIRLNAGIVYGNMIVFSDGLTDSETATVISAAVALRNAFIQE